VRAARSRWRKRQDWLKRHLHLLGRIVFIDETGLNTKMARLRGRSAKGQRLVASIPHGHWKTMTFIAGLRHDGMTAPWVLDGPMDGPAFITYIKTQLAPTLQKGDVVVLDNLPAHKVAAAGAVSAAVLARSEPDRTRLLKAQSTHEAIGAENRRWPMERCRRNPRTVLKTGMCKLLQRKRIWTKLNRKCSRLFHVMTEPPAPPAQPPIKGTLGAVGPGERVAWRFC